MGLFSTELPADPHLPEAEDDVLNRLAVQVVKRGMSVPAIMFLESVKPLNYIGSQTMVFFEPIVQSVFNFRDYDTIRSALEKRHSIELLIRKIEEQDAIAQKREKALKGYLREERKNWKWYQRYLGLFQPRVQLPPDLEKNERP